VLSVIEGFIAQIRAVDSIDKARDVLREVDSWLGARSAVLLQFGPSLASPPRVVDTDSHRARAWAAYFGDFGPLGARIAVRRMAPLGRSLAPEARVEDDDPFEAMMRANDLADSIAVPIVEWGEAAGVVFLAGAQRERLLADALPIVCYALFAQVRGLSAAESGDRGPLTRRELEIMRLSADGLTSAEIAERLGISPRTVNQHVDNVVGKLGTRNRAHSIAELLRSAVLT